MLISDETAVSKQQSAASLQHSAVATQLSPISPVGLTHRMLLMTDYCLLITFLQGVQSEYWINLRRGLCGICLCRFLSQRQGLVRVNQSARAGFR